jgi:hypothetical protein
VHGRDGHGSHRRECFESFAIESDERECCVPVEQRTDTRRGRRAVEQRVGTVASGALPFRMVRTEPGLGRSLLLCSAAFCVALLLAVGAVVFYEPPNVIGVSGTSLWLERDFLCSLASGALALLVGWVAGRPTVRPRIFSRLLVHSLVWFGLTVGLFLLWGQYVFLFTLLIAPSHAFAGLRLVLLGQAWRAELAWRAR